VRILLDESPPRPLSRLLLGHTVSTVTREGWTSLSNGALLRQAATRVDVMLTADQNIEFQQNLTTLPLAVVVLVAESNRLESLEPLVPALLDPLRNVKPRTFLRVSATTRRASVAAAVSRGLDDPPERASRAAVASDVRLQHRE
jgi:hypothetical protein